MPLPKLPDIQAIARVAHEINRAYCEALGDKTQLPWDEAPQWQRESAEKGVIFHLRNPGAGPEASHEEWSKHKVAEGWKWGPVKDEAARTHPCLMPFSYLPDAQRAKDHLFRATVHQLKDVLFESTATTVARITRGVQSHSTLSALVEYLDPLSGEPVRAEISLDEMARYAREGLLPDIARKF